MSIASEITRLQTAKADLKTAIEGKGVTVSSSAKLDAYPALVESISGGGSDDDTWYIVVNHTAKYMVEKDPYNNRWYVLNASAIRYVISQDSSLNCWLEYKGEKYYVASFSNGAQITKQGSPQRFYNEGLYNTIFIEPTVTEDVYVFHIYDD